MKVLDVATGTARVSIEIAEKVGEHGMVLGIDSSKPMLKQAVKKAKERSYHNTDFILADAYHLFFPADCFDVVTSCFALIFLSDPQEAASEMARVVKQGGKVASVEWEKPPLDFWVQIRKKANIHDFVEAELTGILHNSGLREIRTKRIQVLHRRPCVSEEAVKKFEFLSARIMGLEENDAKWFFQRVREEYKKLPEERRSWLPILYVGVRNQKRRK